ncbi:MAG: hypothetical protein LAT64_01620 [Phycisphaerales bacterium]|nr:hypothetical protein [Planctomycetota bacterium]MCH8507461.1 hypothetical protein [Phycisphaerales bacterium]
MSQFDQPDPSAAPAGPQHAPGAPVGALPPRELSGVRIPMLLAGIFNCMAALGWFGTCFLFFLGIPLLALGIFEIITFTKLGESRATQDALRSKCRTFAILDICAILLFNLPAMVCGIIQMVNHKQFDE